QRSLVLAASRRARCVHGADVGRRDRDGAGEALPRLVPDRRPAGRRRTLRAGRQLPARGRRRVHPHLVAPVQDVVGGRAGPGDGAGMTTALWSGRLPGGLDPEVKAFTASLAVDRRLLPYDLRATAAHVRMLAAQGILEPEQAIRICAALEDVEVGADATDEDVHSAIERELGELGRWVHAGRSRNDQVQTAMRLWVKDACDGLAAGVRDLAGALL